MYLLYFVKYNNNNNNNNNNDDDDDDDDDDTNNNFNNECFSPFFTINQVHHTLKLKILCISWNIFVLSINNQTP